MRERYDGPDPFVVDKAEMRDAVCRMLQINLGVKPAERVVFLADVPDLATWQKAKSLQLADLTKRALLALMAAEVTRAAFPKNTIGFHAYPALDRHGAEPPEDVTKAMVKADVVVMMNTFSLTHTIATDRARQAGTRGVSMPGCMPYMFSSDSPLLADPVDIADAGATMAALLDRADVAEVTTPAGTEMRLGLADRPGQFRAGDLTEPGVIDNLPAGEAFIVPVEGTSQGCLVVEAGWLSGLAEKMTLVFERGQVVEVRGGGELGDEYRALLGFGNERLASRRNCAELGIGTNPLAKRPTNLLEAEKIKGTVHIAIGSNASMGGKVQADIHQDFVLDRPTLILDGKAVIRDGEWLV